VRILPFDRGFAARAGSSVVIVVAQLDGNDDSTSASKQMSKALLDIGDVSNKPIRVETVSYSGPASLVTECRNRGALATYLTPGFAAQVPGIARSLVGAPVLTLAAVESYVPQGAVLGVEVLSGKPRISVNLSQAKSQGLDFPSALLKLARVYR
jgi:hypothetical protein